MGLLNYIKSHGLDKPHGLLARSVRMLREGTGEFASVCVALGARHAALLMNRSGVFRVTHAYAFDARTLVTSVSSVAWWSGTLGAEGRRAFSRVDGTLSACCQLLSSPFRDKVTDVMAVAVEPSVVFLCLMLEGEDIVSLCTDEIIRRAMKSFVEKGSGLMNDMPNFEEALKTADAVLCRLDVSKAVEKSLVGLEAKDATGVVKCDIREALYGELLQIMRVAFPSPSYCTDNKDGTIRLVLFVGSDFDQDLALFHIQTHLKSIFGDGVEDVDLLNECRASSVDAIMSFIN